MTMPATSFDFIVVIPCYNDVKGLSGSLGSIRYRTNNIMVLVIDDGSDVTLQKSVVENFLTQRATVELITLSENVGITKALNTGLSWITSRNGSAFHCNYVARLDCGDLCSPDRFNRQVDFLNENRKIDLLGTWCVFEDFETGDKFVYKTPTEDRKIRRAMYFRNIFIHPTVMWRMDIMKEHHDYPDNFPHAEDYGLFYQWIDADFRTAVLPEKLVTCRINPKGLSLANRNHQLRSRMKVINTYGRNKILRSLGVLKLWTLIAIPYPLIFKMKKLLAGDR